MQYQHLAEVYEKISKTSKRLEKTSLCAALLKSSSDSDLQYIIPLLQGKMFPDWNEAKIGVASKLVIKALSISSGNTANHIESLWKKIGDLGEVAAKVMENKKQSTLVETSLTIKKVFENIVKLSQTDGTGSVDLKMKLIAELLTSASALEAKYITRTVLEDLRVGVGDSSLRDAIAWAYLTQGITYDQEKNDLILPEGREKYNALIETVQHAYDVTNDYAIVAHTALKKGLTGIAHLELTIGNPIKVMLFPKAKDIPDAFSVVGNPAAFEYKYDGFRMQIHKLAEDNIIIFTRRLENVTKQFPEIKERVLQNIDAKNFVLDCEAVGYDPVTKKYLPFQKISQRIRRKYDIEKTAKDFPVELNIFDIIYCDGESLLKTPFKKRRQLLEKITKQKSLSLTLAKQITTTSPNEAKKFYDEALLAGNEGLMAKNLEGIYKPGARVGYGIKIKPIMESLDLVIVGAEWGTGKRAGWLTSFTIACLDEDGMLQDMGKVGTGVKEKEEEGVSFDQLTELLRPLITSELGKEVTVKPEIIIEVHYEEIQKSPTYSSGFALRFPRFIRLREDKSLDEISSLVFIEELYFKQRGR